MELLEHALVNKAVAFAEMAHAGVVRKFTGEPYVEHCKRVAAHLSALGFDPDVVAAAVLHDVVEDTHISAAVLAAEFGPRVAALVVEVSKPKKIPGMSKAARLAAVVEHLAASSYAGASIKLADMLDNSSNVAELSPEFAEKYLPEMAQKLAVLGHGHPELVAKVAANLTKGAA
jgi:(p)ppGpp synthase/HD superfamily hydrolase